MFSVTQRPVPEQSLLKPYDDMEGCSADCFETLISGAFGFADYVEAFFTTPLFRAERWILGWAISKPSRDAEIRALAQGNGNGFAAWEVEDRGPHQLLLTVTNGSVRTWLMMIPAQAPDTTTKLLFGSAVLPKPETGEKGFIYKALGGFHIIYSKLLLWSAKRRMKQGLKAGR